MNKNDTTRTIKTASLCEGLDLGNYGQELTEYRDSSIYICEAITQIADGNTSIYYCDIWDFISENPEALADVVEEGIYSVESGVKYNLYEHGQAAEYMMIERDLYDHLADALMFYIVDYIVGTFSRDCIPVELAEELRCIVEETDVDDTFDTLRDKINRLFFEED